MNGLSTKVIGLSLLLLAQFILIYGILQWIGDCVKSIIQQHQYLENGYLEIYLFMNTLLYLLFY